VSLRGSVILIGLFFLGVQAFLLPPGGWVTGDQGSKYLQTRAFAAQGPLNPGIEVLARDIDPEYRHQEPKLKNRRGRLVSEFLWLLPLVTAPFYLVFGMRGLYVVPALSVIAIFLAAAALGRRLGDDHGLGTGWTVLLVTPMVVYGLEFWEHAPAVACVMGAAVLAFPGEAGFRMKASMRLVLAGAAIGAGALFREEVVVALPALVLARAVAFPGDWLKTTAAAGVWMTAGAGIVFTAAVPMNLLIYGAALPMHMTQDVWEVAKKAPYMQVRRELIVELLLPASHAAAFVVAALAGLGASLTQAWRQRTRAGPHDDRASRALLVIVHLSALVILIIAVALPLWHMAMGVRTHDAYRVTSAAHTWPFALALFYWPWFVTDTSRPAARFLIVSGLLLVAGTFIVAPTVGGSQWSPRFFLAAAPLLAVVAAAAARSSVAATLRPIASVILLASMVMQVTGVGWVQRSKFRYARLTAWVASRTAPGDVLISDVFWFPEVTATLAPTRRMLFSWSATEVPAMAASAAALGVRGFRVITSPQLTGYTAPPAFDLPGAPCRYTRGQPIAYGELLINEYVCEAP